MLRSTALFGLSAAVALAHGDQDHDESFAVQSRGDKNENVNTFPLIILGGAFSNDETDWSKLSASVVDVSPTATVFTVNCDESTGTACVMPGGIITQGPSVLEWNYGPEYEGAFTQKYSCSLDYEQDSLDCLLQLTTTRDDVIETSTTQVATNGLSDMLFSVTITGGMDKILAALATTATTDQTTLSTASSKLSESASTTSQMEASSTTISGNAAFPMITQNAVLAGVAAVVAGVMIL